MSCQPPRPAQFISADSSVSLRHLSRQLLHPDILLSILSYLPPTHLPPLLRVSRYFHAQAGSLLYRDSSLYFTPLALCPHISPLGSMYAFSSSTSDLRAIMHDRPSRKRSLLESARVLRLSAHSHLTIPAPLRDLKLDVSGVDTVYLDGSVLCDCEGGVCTMFRGLKPRVVVMETNNLGMDRIPGLDASKLDHLVIKLRPPQTATYPPPIPGRRASGCLHRVRKVSVVFAPQITIDSDGMEVTTAWRPVRQAVCGPTYLQTVPTLDDLVEHLADRLGACEDVTLIGTETLDAQWAILGQLGNRTDEYETTLGEVDSVHWVVVTSDGLKSDPPRDTRNQVTRRIKETWSMASEARMPEDVQYPLPNFRDLAGWQASSEGYPSESPALSAGLRKRYTLPSPVQRSKRSPICW